MVEDKPSECEALRIYDIVADEVRDCTQRDLEMLQIAAGVLGRVWIAEAQCEDYESIMDSLARLHHEFKLRIGNLLQAEVIEPPKEVQ